MSSKVAGEWAVVGNTDIRHLWECPTCGATAPPTPVYVGPAFYEESGNPICGTCGDDLEYCRTEARAATLPGPAPE